MTVRAIVSRLNPENPLAAVQFLHRSEALLAEDEWSWSEERAGAWEEEHELVGRVSEQLRAARGWRCWVLVLSAEEALAARERREAERVAQAQASVRVICPEPEFETTGRPPVRRAAKSIAERVAIARRGARTRRSTRTAMTAAEAERRWQEEHDQ